MIYHFDRLQETLGEWISKNLDHRLLLEKYDPAVKPLIAANEDILTLDFHPTAENIAKMIFDQAKELNLPVCKVEVWESETAKAAYEEG